MDGVKVAMANRGMTVEAARQCAKDRKERGWDAWRGVGCLERGGMPLHDVVGINFKKSPTSENQGADVKYLGKGVYVDDCVNLT